MADQLEFHPLANLFPLMDGEEFDALVADIKANGLREYILLHEGRILDGRNRYRACVKAGVEPEFDEYQRRGWAGHARGGPLAYVLSKNLHRRHLTTDQRAAIAAELATLDHGGDRRSDEFKGSDDTLKVGLTVTEAAKAMKVSTATVKRARARKAVDPEAHEQAKVGTLPRRKPEPRKVTVQERTETVRLEVPYHERQPEAEPNLVPTSDPLTAGRVPSTVTGGCKMVSRSGALINRVWSVRRAHHTRRVEPIELTFGTPSKLPDTFELDPASARAMAKGLLAYADWLDPERLPGPDPEPQRELEEPAPEEEHPTPAPGDLDNLRTWALGMDVERLAKHLRASGYENVGTPLTKFLNGAAGSYHLHRALKAVRAEMAEYT